MWKSMKRFKKQHPILWDFLCYIAVFLVFAAITTAGGLEFHRVVSFIFFSSIGMCIYLWRKSIRLLRGDEKVYDIFDYHKAIDITNEHYRNAMNSAENSNVFERNNSSAELTILFAGTFTVGIDIPPGRYIITAGDSGNFFVREGDTPIVVAKLINGENESHPSGVPSITTDLKTGQEIEIRGINNATFTPAT